MNGFYLRMRMRRGNTAPYHTSSLIMPVYLVLINHHFLWLPLGHLTWFWPCHTMTCLAHFFQAQLFFLLREFAFSDQLVQNIDNVRSCVPQITSGNHLPLLVGSRKILWWEGHWWICAVGTARDRGHKRMKSTLETLPETSLQNFTCCDSHLWETGIFEWFAKA